MDRDYMRRPSSLGGATGRNGLRWQKYLWIAAAVIGLSVAAFYVYRDARETFKPAEGSLLVNINTATQEELETVPGIGPTRAALIISGRPYAQVEELDRVYGIGQLTVEGIRPFVKTEGETERR